MVMGRLSRWGFLHLSHLLASLVTNPTIQSIVSPVVGLIDPVLWYLGLIASLEGCFIGLLNRAKSEAQYL